MMMSILVPRIWTCSQRLLPWQRKLQIQSECSRNRPACIDVCAWDV